MEFYLREVVDAHRRNSNTVLHIDFRNETLSYETCNLNRYTEVDRRHIIERLFYKYIDGILDGGHSSPSLHIVLDRLYAGDYQSLSSNFKSYLFESLELCSPKLFLSWIDKILDCTDEGANVNLQAFGTYVDMKRARGSTQGEIRYTLLCEPSAKLLELLVSQIHRHRLVSKHAWLAVLRLKQQLTMTSVQKDLFNEWLGIV